jgi:pyruvate formate lyase activating enzyme
MPTVWAVRFPGCPFVLGQPGGPICRKECKMMKGYLNSCRAENGLFEVLVQGCTLRCAYCDRPTCWEKEKAPLVLTAEELLEQLQQSGAGTLLVSGGEPLEQAEFLTAVFAACREKGITTVLDTPGSRVNPEVEALLDVTDKVQLHLKDSTEEGYRRYTGGSLLWATMFLELLEKKQIPTDLRQLLVPGINDTPDNARFMKGLPRKYSCVKSCVFLPFAKGETPALYAALGLEYPMKAYRDATAQDVSDMKYY